MSTIVTFTFTNPAPVAVDDQARTEPDTAVRIPVLGNDHDGGRDRDTLTVVSATPSSGTVTINPDGSLNFLADPGFAGLVTINYTISDGQGGFATATARVLVTPNIHTTGAAVAVPYVSDSALPSNSGIVVEGAVLSAVHGMDPSGSNTSMDSPTTSAGIDAGGIIVAAANQISGLGGIGSGRDGATASHMDPRHTNPVWRLENLIEREFGRPESNWNPEGLTGFSLRYTFASDPRLATVAQVVMESMVRERTLIVNLSSTAIPDHAHVIEYRVMQADGRPLPGWLDRAGAQVLIGERPVDVEEIKLRVIAILSDGTTIERSVVIQTMSGEIKPLEDKRANVVPLFTDQLRTEATRGDAEFDNLLKALGR